MRQALRQASRTRTIAARMALYPLLGAFLVGGLWRSSDVQAEALHARWRQTDDVDLWEERYEHMQRRLRVSHARQRLVRYEREYWSRKAPQLLWTLFRDERFADLKSRGHGECIVPALIRTFRSHEDWHLRIRAGLTLARVFGDDPRVLVVMVQGLDDPEAYVRVVAARGLMEMGPQAARARPLLVARLEDPDADVREAVVYALDAVGLAPERKLKLMRRALADESEDVRVAAVSVLTDCRADPDQLARALLEAMEDSSLQVRQRAVWALDRVDPESPELQETIERQVADSGLIPYPYDEYGGYDPYHGRHDPYGRYGPYYGPDDPYP